MHNPQGEEAGDIAGIPVNEDVVALKNGMDVSQVSARAHTFPALMENIEFADKILFHGIKIAPMYPKEIPMWF